MTSREPFVVPTGDRPANVDATVPAPPPAGDAAAAYAAAADAGDAVADHDHDGTEAGAADAAGEGEVEEPVSELEALAARAAMADDYLMLAQRTKADFENYRKRAARDAAIAQERGITKLAKELLPAIDNLDRAVQAIATWGAAAQPPVEGAQDATASHEAQLASGLELVHAAVLSALARVGIEPFSPAGEVFDPQHHEAVAQTPVAGAAPGTVVEVYQQGYRMGEIVLRPARVLVAA